MLRTVATHSLENMWGKETSRLTQAGGPSIANEIVYEKIEGLSPKDDEQTSLKSQALNMVMDLAQTRWLMFAQKAAPLSTTLLVVLVFWLTIIFISFGLFSPRNITAVASLLFSALAVSCAILLILEMSAPYSGLIQVSKGPLRAAISRLGQ